MKKSWENNGKDHGKIMEIFLDVTRHGDEKNPEIMGRSWNIVGPIHYEEYMSV